MVNDPENSKYQHYLARLQRTFKPRSSRVIIVAIALVTFIAIIVFVKALPHPSPSPLVTRAETASTQSMAQLLPPPQPRPEGQLIQNQAAALPPSPVKEIRPGDDARGSQGLDSLRTLSTLQQELDQIKQEQEKQIQTIASQLELISRQQETSLQAATRMATQILELSQKAAAVSTQHQESVKAIAALETKIGNSQAGEASASIPTPTASSGGNPAVRARATPRVAGLHL